MGMSYIQDLIRGPQSEFRGQHYTATVVNNDDSGHEDGQKRQRCRLRIPVLHRGIPDDQLPYSMPMPGGGPTNAGGGVGSVNVPPKGAKVYVRFDGEDPHTPYYVSSPTTDDVHKDNELLKEDYPHTSGSVDAYGNKQSVNRKQGTITDTHKSGSMFHRNKDGDIVISAARNLILQGGGDIKVASKGKTQVYGQGDVEVGSKSAMRMQGQGGLSLKTPVPGGVSINPLGSIGDVASLDPTIGGARDTPVIPDASGQTSA